MEEEGATTSAVEGEPTRNDANFDATEVENRLRREVFSTYPEVYGDLSETWRQLDNKAQGTIAIAGIFLAGTFALITSLPETATNATKICLFAAMASLILSVGLSVFALRVRSYDDVAPLGDSLHDIVKRLIEVEDLSDPEILRRHYSDRQRMWSKTNKAVAGINRQKATTLFVSQVAVLVAILVATLSTVLRVMK